MTRVQKYSMSSALANEEARLRFFFDPDDHPENTLKAFQEFIQRFELHYDAMYPDPPKVSLEAATEQWKIMEATSENPSPKPNLEQFDNLCEHTKACNKVSKFLGIYSSRRLYIDWCMATPEEKTRKNAQWKDLEAMSAYYKPTGNITLIHFHFQSNIQKDGETFIAFCNHVLLEAKHCNFKCTAESCIAEDTAVCDQIIIGLKTNDIHQEALKKSWDLDTLRREGMKMESAARGGAEINGEDINKMVAYSFKSLKDKQSIKEEISITCYNCGTKTSAPIKRHKVNCPARSVKCYNCQCEGHFSKFCKSTKTSERLRRKSRQITI